MDVWPRHNTRHDSTALLGCGGCRGPHTPAWARLARAPQCLPTVRSAAAERANYKALSKRSMAFVWSGFTRW
jgi:hypothetical protein